MSPTGISTPQDLINYFTSIEGKGIVSGEFVETGDPASTTTDPLNTVQSETGQNVGIVGIDYWHYGVAGPAITVDANAEAIANWDAGGLVEISPSIPNPTTGGGLDDTSNLDVADLLTPGTATNNALNVSLSQLGAGLQQLQAAGVVVLFRPFYESNGNWFWWGAGELSATEFQALWQYTYNYMTNTMGLHNLAWVYAINAGTALPGRTLTDTYPGSAYVDMTGQDLYSDNPSEGQSTYQALTALGKPTALSEFGSGSPSSGDPNFSMPTLISQVRADMPDTVYWLQWWSQNAGGAGWGMEQDQNTSAALNDGYVINRGQIANTVPASPIPTPTSAVTPSANDTTVEAGSSAAITDAAGNQWTITSGGQVALNGTPDTTTASVTELAYINGTIWQENDSGLWWGKTSPAASWSPASGTSNSPLPTAHTFTSADDTVVRAGSAAAITDGAGNQWTITSKQQVAVNGAADATTANVIELAYVNGTVWQENASGLWWGETSPTASWSPTTGTSTSPLLTTPAPTPAPTPTIKPSANDTVVRQGSSMAIADTAGNKWTITSSGQVAVNGTLDATTANVTELVYVNGTVWQENASGLWWGKMSPAESWSPSSGTSTSPLPITQTPTPTPTPAPTPAPTPTPTITPSANDTVVAAGSTAAIVDAAGNQWTITSDRQVAVNGTPDTTTANVTDLAYVSGTVWQENASGLWWGKMSPAASWLPSSGTSTSPLPMTQMPPPTPAALGTSSNPLVIMPLGDSITASGGTAYNGGPPPGGYRAPLYAGLTDAGYAVQYVGNQTSNPGGGLPANEDNHEGIGGYSIETVDNSTVAPGLLDYIQNNNILQTYQPNVILLEIGSNNIYSPAPENVGPTEAFVFLQQMVNYIFQTLPNVKLIVSTLPVQTGDLGVPTSDPNSSSEIGYYNHLILNDLKAAINNPNLSVVDMNGAENSYTGPGGVASLIGPDGIHPSVAGYQVIANTMLAGIEAVEPPPGSTPTSAPTPTLTPTPAPTPSPTASPNDTMVLAGASGTITDSSGNTWTINSSGQVSVNGVADTTTATVSELAYVNGTVWQQNANGMWWGKSSPTAAWSPGTGTSISPLPAPITIAPAAVSATVSQSQVSVVATGSIQMLFVNGSGDVISLSDGAGKITDSGSRNTYILPVGGNGSDTFTSNILTVGDTLDLKTALAATDWNGAASTLPEYLTVAGNAKGATLSIARTSGGAGSAIATIDGTITTNLTSVLAHAIT